MFFCFPLILEIPTYTQLHILNFQSTVPIPAFVCVCIVCAGWCAPRVCVCVCTTNIFSLYPPNRTPTGCPNKGALTVFLVIDTGLGQGPVLQGVH